MLYERNPKGREKRSNKYIRENYNNVNNVNNVRTKKGQKMTQKMSIGAST